MIFQHTYQQILNGTKTKTRRLVKPEHIKAGALNVLIAYVYTRPDYGGGFLGDRKLWQVGNTYAVQPGRGQKAIGRIRITAIRQEKLQDISEEDAVAEGMRGVYQYFSWGDVYEGGDPPIEEYRKLWDSIHTKPGTRWQDNPNVFVLSFKLFRPPEKEIVA